MVCPLKRATTGAVAHEGHARSDKRSHTLAKMLKTLDRFTYNSRRNRAKPTCRSPTQQQTNSTKQTANGQQQSNSSTKRRASNARAPSGGQQAVRAASLAPRLGGQQSVVLAPRDEAADRTGECNLRASTAFVGELQ
eukprot:1658013-Pleurochrysis_carterae.AAC.2